jgi:glyoxylase-like metal-dependent hydrolase (beta-lactamase superfamily II)
MSVYARCLVVAALGSLALASPGAPAGLQHYAISRLADGVWAALAKDGGAAMSNAGIVDLGGTTLVFDTSFTPQAGSELRRAAEQLTKHPVKFVMNSHYHSDHIRGNQVYPAATVVSTSRTRDLIDTRGRDELKDDLAHAAGKVTAYQAALARAKTEEERRDAEYWLALYRGVVATLPSIRLRLPDLTFESRQVFHGRARSAELITYGGGHTPSDAFLFLPAERIAFMGDLILIDNHPYLPDGDPDEWLKILDRLEELPITRIVPGHGPVGGAEAVPVVRGYITAVQRVAADLVRSGRRPEDAVMPEAFRSWRFGNYFPDNIRFLYDREKGR